MSSCCDVIGHNCKYHDEEEGCLFYALGSGEEEDKPCYEDEEEGCLFYAFGSGEEEDKPCYEDKEDEEDE